MKNWTSIALVCILLLHVAGFYAYFVVRLVEVRREMRFELSLRPTEALDVINVPRSQFRESWKEEMEMKWEGKMVDIARLEVDGALIRVFCLHDEAEDDLISFISTVATLASQDHHPVPSSIIQFTLLEFEFLDKISLALPELATMRHNSFCNKACADLMIPVVVPPPRG